MYIRWVVRRHKNDSTANVTFHDAYLVESYRGSEDSPRQRMICYLGNIRQIGESFPPIEREIFLLRAEGIVRESAHVPPDERANVLQLLRKKIPPLHPDEVRTAFLWNLRWYSQWCRENGIPLDHEEVLRILTEVDSAEDAH